MGRYWFMTVLNNAYVFFVSLFLVHCSLVSMSMQDQHKNALELAADCSKKYEESLLKQIRSNYDQYFANKRFTIRLAVSSLVGGLIGGLYYAFGLRLPTISSAHTWKNAGSLAAIAATSLVSYGVGRYCSNKAQPYLARRELKKAARSGDNESFRMLEKLGYVKPENDDRICLKQVLEEQRRQAYENAHAYVGRKYNQGHFF